MGQVRRHPGRHHPGHSSPGAGQSSQRARDGRERPMAAGHWPGCFILGLALAIWARLYLGRNWGMPMSQKVDPELVTTGPYRSIRHPIYSGIILAMIGTTIAVSLYWLIAVVVVGAYFLYSAIVEERSMARLFPDSYPEYKRSTKMLIPHII